MSKMIPVEESFAYGACCNPLANGLGSEQDDCRVSQMIGQEAVMADDLAEFRQRLLAFAKVAVTRAEKIDNEAATNLQLVQPFLTLLGYDVTNPDEVSPEHHADFSEKYQNKVDYAILRADCRS
jgi:hypothetical protein